LNPSVRPGTPAVNRPQHNGASVFKPLSGSTLLFRTNQPVGEVVSRSLEEVFEQNLFRARWIMAPFYVGLMIGLFVLLITFGKELVEETANILTLSLDENHVVLWLLTLIDMSLAGNLTLMVVFAGYENFVSKLDLEGNPDKPDWMGRVDFSNMKLKLVASIIAISVIHLLKNFMSIDTEAMDPNQAAAHLDYARLTWLVSLHMVFVVSGVLLAAMDWLGEHAAENKPLGGE
jgi:uncharacterized protein (TIGR00645 family)